MDRGPRGGEGVQGDRELAPRRDGRGVPRPADRDQGTAHDPDRRRLPQPQRRAATAARPVRVPAPGPLVPGRALAGQAPRARRHGDLPREHRGRLCGHGGRGVHEGRHSASRLPERDVRMEHPRGLGHRHQADQRVRLEAARPRGDRLRAVARTHVGQPRAQGEHPEVHRGRLQQVGLRAREGGVRGRRRRVGRLRRRPGRQVAREGLDRRHYAPAGADAAGGVRCDRHHEPQRRLPLRRARRASRRDRDRAGRTSTT